MKQNKRVIGLTGGVGSGKSMVMDVMKREYDVLALVADDIGRKAMERGTKTYEEIVACFGEDVLDENKNIRTDRIAETIFSNAAMRKKQSDIIHPFVADYIGRELERSKKPLAVIESAILVQAGYQGLCDEIWVVFCEVSKRRERLKANRGYSDERIDAIMKNQWTDSMYFSHCDRVIHNDGDEGKIKEQIRRFCQGILSKKDEMGTDA